MENLLVFSSRQGLKLHKTKLLWKIYW